MRKLVTYVTLACFLATRTLAIASPHDEGLAAGQAANPVIQGTVNAPSATTVVPGYTTTPPETAYYGSSNLAGQANTALVNCALTSNDPVCQAQLTAVNSANTPRTYVSPYDPSVAGARGIFRDPSVTLGGLAAYYSGCATSTVSSPGGKRNQLCHRYAGVGNYSCFRSLAVDVSLNNNCTPGTWFAVSQVDRNPDDHIFAEAYCEPYRADGLQKFRFYAHGLQGACIDWQTVELPIAQAVSAEFVTQLSPHWGGFCWPNFDVVMAAGSGCTGTACNYNFQFGTPVWACGAGEIAGDKLFPSFGIAQPIGRPNTCYAVAPVPFSGTCVPGKRLVHNQVGAKYCAGAAAPAKIVAATGWNVPLAFTKPGITPVETDRWNDQCPVLAASDRCMVTTADVCVDGPSTKQINGQDVTRPCWRYERTHSCANGSPTDECASLVATGCAPVASVCKQPNAVTGVCEIFEDTYQCPVAASRTTSVSNCPPNVFCIAGNCFDTNYANDADFARSISYMEAGREAGVYLDANNLRVFRGEDNHCRDRLLKNCCYTDSAGAGMSNQSVFGGTASRLVFDILMNSGNREFVYQGLKAMLLGSSFGAGTFTAYGVTVAVNGAALPAGSTLIGSNASGTLVVGFDPWSLVIAVVIYIVLSQASCNQEEGKLAMKEGAGLCHYIGNRCTSRFLGACIEHTSTKCCFNSKLSRIINEQGRPQLGKGWGTTTNPDCSGFSVGELQTLNFAAMDLTEFYASIVPKMPNVGGIQTNNASRTPTCYFGQGKC